MNTFTESLGLALRMIVGADVELLQIVRLSLQVSSLACLFGAAIGLVLGAWLAVARFRGLGVAVWALNTALAMPAVVTGLVVYLLLSRAGPLGAFGILFTPGAMVVAQTLLVVPLIAALARRLVVDSMQEGGDQLRSLGAAPLTSALLMLVHERFALLTIMLTAFGRAISEVGTVMIVGGNIAGVTRVMTTAIALETTKGDLPLALALGIVLLAVVGALNLGIDALRIAGSRSLRDESGPTEHVPSLEPLPRRPASPPLPLITLRGATVRFGTVTALRDVALTLHRGERLALVGANGSGKTTLLRLLHGLLPDTGDCQRLPLQPEGRRPVAAMLFQRPFLLRLSVRRNVLIGLWLRGVPRGEREARCSGALRRVGLSALSARPSRALSGGQQQRLALARAWALAPDILYLDEPTASLDPSAKNEVEALIAEIAASGVTLVISTHNLGQAKRLATRVAYLEGGRLVVDLPVARYFTDVLPPEAARFLKGELPWI